MSRSLITLVIHLADTDALKYDSLHSDILPFHAISPADFRARQRRFTENVKHSYNMTITPNSLEAGGDRADAPRPGWMQNFIRGFQAHLPPGFEVEVFASDHDIGQILLGRDQWDRTMEAISKGECGSRDFAELTLFSH